MDMKIAVKHVPYFFVNLYLQLNISVLTIHSAEFLTSNTNYELCPKPDRPEYAFIGRSNVGKSSLINMLTGRKGLAKTSQTPGKTQLINHFDINKEWFLVDLPGYGFAKVPNAIRSDFQKMIWNYITKRDSLINTFVLIDIRHTIQKIDLEFMANLGENNIPFTIIFTKADKLSASQLQQNLNKYKEEMLTIWSEMPHFFVSSSENKTGKEDILRFIASLHQYYTPLAKK